MGPLPRRLGPLGFNRTGIIRSDRGGGRSALPFSPPEPRSRSGQSILALTGAEVRRGIIVSAAITHLTAWLFLAFRRRTDSERGGPWFRAAKRRAAPGLGQEFRNRRFCERFLDRGDRLI